MFRLPYGERVDPMEEKRQARENTISSVITFAVLCAAIRVGKGVKVTVISLD